MNGIKVGFAMCGSFCTFSAVIEEMKKLVSLGYDVFPIMSPISRNADTRFGKAEDFARQVEELTGKKIISTIMEAEPIGPQKLIDVMLVAPCTGNTLGKIANGITDTSVTMAVKAHLRNLKPVVIAVSTNDALSASAKNIGVLLNTKNVFFVPMGQDSPEKKATSLVADFSLIDKTIEMALIGEQLQPILINNSKKI